MNREVTLREKLTNAFSPMHLEILNESHMHSGPADAQTHFKVIMTANVFDQKSRVARHQLIYGVLDEEFSSGLHALALHLYAESEWRDRTPVPDSPNCLGGSKNSSSSH